jgi:uncharacterized protein YjgD (DUF1641 family)
MSALINLLPDIRQAKLREVRRRQAMSGTAIAAWIVCGIVILGLSLTTATQKVLISKVTTSVSDKKQTLLKTEGLVEALTAQQHLDALPGLYSKRVYMTRFFAALSSSDPSDITLSSMNVDGINLLTVTGEARTYASVAKLARALTFAPNLPTIASPTLNTNAGISPYFSNVAITEVSKSSTKGVSFTLQATMEPGVTNAGN